MYTIKCHPQAAPLCPHSHKNSPVTLHLLFHPAHGQCPLSACLHEVTLANVGSNNEDMHPHTALACLSQFGLGEFIDAQKASQSEAASQKDEYLNARGARLVGSSFS